LAVRSGLIARGTPGDLIGSCANRGLPLEAIHPDPRRSEPDWRPAGGRWGFHPRSIAYERAGFGRKKVPMELLLVIIILILLFGGGFSFYRR
jgi:hypothetical protein